MRRKSLLIIGCGYLGRRVGRLAIAEGWQVHGTTRAVSRADRLTTLGIEPVVFDVLDPASNPVLPDVSNIVYCVGRDRSTGVDDRRLHVDGLSAVLNRLPCERPGRLVYASSTGVYGVTNGDWVDESDTTKPRTASGRAILEAESLAAEFAARTGWITVRLRLAGLYGPDRIIRRAPLERGEPIPGDPDHWLNLIHIQDAARAALAALQAPAPSPVYLVSDDHPLRRRDYYEALARLVSAPPPRFEPAAGAATMRDATSKRVSNRLLRAELLTVLHYPEIASGLPAALAEEAG